MPQSTATGLFSGEAETDPETVLVGVVRTRADLNRAVKEGWYRIPGTVHFRRRPAYLALYPVKSCGQAGGKISWYFPVQQAVRQGELWLR